MPLYEYQCKKCGEVFEVRATIKEKTAGLEPACPKCGEPDARQLLSTVRMISGGKEFLSARMRPECRAGLLRMSDPVIVQIVGAPVACKDGVKDTWRATAVWAGEQLRLRFGDRVRVEYFDLFDPAAPPVPPGTRLPLVTVNGEMLSSGGKISIPALRRKIETLQPGGPVTDKIDQFAALKSNRSMPLFDHSDFLLSFTSGSFVPSTA